MTNEKKQILLFGAGKSATVLISYLLEQSLRYPWKLVVVDTNLPLVQAKLNDHVNGVALSFDMNNQEERGATISRSDIVISMLPPALHYLVAQDCLHYGKHLLTASYLDEPIRKLENEINRKGLLFLCEMGLDPGIDHMSAMQMIEQIKNEGGLIKSFKSHCGGLIAPESDNNPWHYKITWNPANIVHAGKTGAIYKHQHTIVESAYPDIFSNNETVSIPGLGPYAWYPNRDSLAYATLYGLKTAHTFMRTTLRHPDFCRGWQYIIDAGLTNTHAFNAKHASGSIADWFMNTVKQRYFIDDFNDYINTIVSNEDRDLLKAQLHYLHLQSQEPVPEKVVSPAGLMQYLLETYLKMEQEDRDMIIMLHEVAYEKNNQLYSTKSCMIVKGDDVSNTAMAKTVGLPLGIATEFILEGKMKLKGLHIPIIKDIYKPVLMKLKEKKISFEES